jgi:hypothetical protein
VQSPLNPNANHCQSSVVNEGSLDLLIQWIIEPFVVMKDGSLGFLQAASKTFNYGLRVEYIRRLDDTCERFI